MASSKRNCFHCKVDTTQLRNGWRFRGGDFAKLCKKCCSEYENDSFCETFHLDSDGWRDCRICEKMIHCGCRMSIHMYETLDFGGISCLACSRQSFVLEPNLKNSSGAECDLNTGPKTNKKRKKLVLEQNADESAILIRQLSRGSVGIGLDDPPVYQKILTNAISAVVTANAITMQKQMERIAELEKKLAESKQGDVAKEASIKAMVTANTVIMQKQLDRIAELEKKLAESKQDDTAKEPSMNAVMTANAVTMQKQSEQIAELENKLAEWNGYIAKEVANNAVMTAYETTMQKQSERIAELEKTLAESKYADIAKEALTKDAKERINALEDDLCKIRKEKYEALKKINGARQSIDIIHAITEKLCSEEVARKTLNGMTPHPLAQNINKATQSLLRIIKAHL